MRLCSKNMHPSYQSRLSIAIQSCGGALSRAAIKQCSILSPRALVSLASVVVATDFAGGACKKLIRLLTVMYDSCNSREYYEVLTSYFRL
jgi:hypothetical protein